MTVLAGMVGTAVEADQSAANAASLVQVTLTANYMPAYNAEISTSYFNFRAQYALKDFPIMISSGTILIMSLAEATALISAGGASTSTPYTGPS
jgi:hypothetical protein